jgi:DTW domain-containing protein YfiP
VVGLYAYEEFAEEDLHSWLYAEGKTPILLYPSTEMGQTIATSALTNPSQLRLVLLDATWRKSRKMLFRNPLLQSLPRLALTDMPSSRYAIRKAHALDQLSSFEACCYALMQLEKNAEKYTLGLQIFDDFIAQMQRQTALHSTQK